MIRRGANAPKRIVGGARGAPPTAFGSAEFMQGMFTAIEQVVRNIVQAMQVLVRAADTRATTAMKAFSSASPVNFLGLTRSFGCRGLARASYESIRHDSSD